LESIWKISGERTTKNLGKPNPGGLKAFEKSASQNSDINEVPH
jgi:hypothetical protein